MGVFKGTCAVSQLPIKKNEAVRVFILIKQGKDECRQGYELYMPCALSLKGRYNEYGGIESDEKFENTDLILKYFKTVFKQEQIETVHHHLIPTLIESRKNTKYAYVLVKESVYSLMQDLKNSSPKKKDDLVEYVKGLKQSYSVYKSLINSENKEVSRIMKKMGDDPILSIYGLDSGLEFSTWNKIYVQYFKENGLSSKMEERLNKDLHLLNLMDDLRKNWSIQNGGGSSESNLKLHSEYHQKLTEIISKPKGKKNV
jgi:hypothetical protein